MSSYYKVKEYLIFNQIINDIDLLEEYIYNNWVWK